MSGKEEGGAPSRNFIEEIVEEHLRSGRFGGRVHTRFPPEPNGYLHLGHAKSISVNFGLARKYGGKTNLRFDDTNPTKEEQEFVDSIRESVRWLGFEWDEERFASDDFEQLYAWAEKLIEKGKAYVCDLTPEEVKAQRKSPPAPGVDSPYRGRSVEENLDLFRRMRAGEFPDGSRTLRAKIDMAAPNSYLRDPVMYRIVRATHHRTGDAWCIYPTYDWTHGQSDSIEGITHSVCTLEFEIHRPLYDWYLDQLEVHHPQQIEFAPFNLTHTIVSKRKLRRLVEEGHVRGWDDPRMPTLVGLKRRGVPPEAIRALCERVGTTKVEGTNDVTWLDEEVRKFLNPVAPRYLAVLRPLKLVIENWVPGEVREFEVQNNPEDPAAGTRKVPFSGELFVERTDFEEDPPKKWFRLTQGQEVRLRNACFFTCTEVVKDGSGEVVELRGTWDPDSLGGQAKDGRRVKGTVHWVSAAHAVDAEVRLYDHLFAHPDPDDVPEGEEFTANLNPASLEVLTGAKLEPALAGVGPGFVCQFERTGYFCVDPESTPERLVFNRTTTLRDSWAKMQKKK
ncbi:MAG: glutamine--tRNA ligase/YqeY domain fusion protein [Planctomycetota bacterium JB042]